MKVKDDPAFAKYFKMLKMHLPRGAVEQKMMAEGMNPAVLDDPEAPSPNATAPASAAPAANVMKVKDDPANPQPAQTKKTMKHVAMVTTAVAKITKPKEVPLLGPKPSQAMKPIFVEKIAADVKGTLWAAIDVKSDSCMLESFTDELEQLFASKAPSEKKAVAKPAKAKEEQVVIINDGRRTQNLTIVWKKLKVHPNEVAPAFQKLDLELLTPERVELFQWLLPEDEEVEALKAFKRSGENLTKVKPMEQFLLAMQDVPRLKLKLTVLSVFSTAEGILMDIDKDLEILEQFLTDLENGKALPLLLRLGLHVSNFFNAGTTRVSTSMREFH